MPVDLLFINTVSPLLAGVGLGSLGIVALAIRRGEVVWKLFAGFCFLLMGACLSAFAAVLLRGTPYALTCVRLIPGFAISSILCAMLYIAELQQLSVRTVLFGKEFSYCNSGQGSRVVIFDKELSLAQYMSIVFAVWLLFGGSIATTDWAIEAASVDEFGGITLSRTGWSTVAIVIVLTAVVKMDIFLMRGWKSSPNAAHKRYTALNFLGFSMGYVPPMVANFGLNALGKPMYPALFLGLTVAVVIFYTAILRYQFAQIDELNRGLEQKVLDRTRALEQAQMRLVQAEKMGALGKLVAGVAHEVNNPVGAILGMQQTLTKTTSHMADALAEIPEGTAGRQRMVKLVDVAANASHVIESGTRRVADVVDKLRHFARLDEAEVQLADVGPGIQEAAAFVSSRMGDKVQIQVDLKELPKLRCDVRALNQVWFNLLLNASESLPESEGVIRVVAHADPNAIVVSVDDNGRGMKKDELGRALDPGYTTKGVGVGTGLGLAICYQVIEDHGGRLELKSEQGHGTSATVWLPVAVPQAAQ